MKMIARDGACTSLWQDKSRRYITRQSVNEDRQYDVILAGGGISGVSAALELQKAGLRCAILESNTLCFGTTGGTTAHLNTLMDTPYTDIIKNFGIENAILVARAAKEALAHIQRNIRKYHIDCGFEGATAYMFSQSQEQTEELEEIVTASRKCGLDISYSDTIPLQMPFKKAVAVKGQGKFHPVDYVHALAKAFEEAGGVIIENCRVQAAEDANDLIVQTDLGEFRTRYLIYTTHIPPGVSLLDLRCAPYRTYAMAVRLAREDYPEGLIYDMYDPYHYYRTQEIHAKKYLIVGGEDHKTAHQDNTEACFRKLESHVRNFFEVEKVDYRWSSQYFEPVDGLPYIGCMPDQSGRILVATGYGGNGMTYSTVAALLLKGLVLGKEGPYDKLFNPNRIKPIAGFANFVKENADTLKQLVKGKLAPKEKLEELAGLAPGEGRLVKFEDHAVALYKDDSGNLHALHPICTHMKCNVAWNNAERSWDCPCHGARYDIDGKVLTGPADRDLERIDL